MNIKRAWNHVNYSLCAWNDCLIKILIMSDIKSVLSLLCQHLNSSIKVMMKPEYFRLGKFNDVVDENVVSVMHGIA